MSKPLVIIVFSYSDGTITEHCYSLITGITPPYSGCGLYPTQMELQYIICCLFSCKNWTKLMYQILLMITSSKINRAILQRPD